MKRMQAVPPHRPGGDVLFFRCHSMGPYSILSTRFHSRDLVKRVPLRNRTPASSSSSLLGVAQGTGRLSGMSAKPMTMRTQAIGLEGWAKKSERARTITKNVAPTHIHPTTVTGTGLSSNDTTLDSLSRGTIKRIVIDARCQKEEPRGWSRTRLRPETRPSRIRPPVHENAPVGIRTRAPGSTGRDHRPLDHRGSGRRQVWAPIYPFLSGGRRLASSDPFPLLSARTHVAGIDDDLVCAKDSIPS